MHILHGTKPMNYYKKEIGRIANKIVNNYQFNENNSPVYRGLLDYFLGRPGKYDLQKGIALLGLYGVGKSTILQIMHEFINRCFRFSPNMFRISSTEEIITLSQSENFTESVLLFNSKPNLYGIPQRKPIHVLINEFGNQYNMKNFGTDVNELVDVFIMKRYDIMQQYGKVTHITTNYGTKELKSMFDPRIVDRFKEMFNMIELPGKSFRK